VEANRDVTGMEANLPERGGDGSASVLAARQRNDRGNDCFLIGYQQATQGIRDKMVEVHWPRRSKSGLPLFSCSMMVSDCSNFVVIRETSGKHPRQAI
jgi:hypothetical protein